MSAYNQEFNKDNTILRYIIVALLAELKDKVYYYNQVDEHTTVQSKVILSGRKFVSIEKVFNIPSHS